MQKDYYQVLGVPTDADAKALKEAYRKLALKYHPDRNKDNPEAMDRMKSVNEAYAALSDPDKRREYDALRGRFGSSSARNQFRQTYSDQDIFRGSDIDEILEEIAKNFGFRGVNDVFRDARRQGRGNAYYSFRGSFSFGPGNMFSSAGGGRVRRGPGYGASVAQQVKAGLMNRAMRYVMEKITGAVLPERGEDIDDVVKLPPALARAGGPFAYFHREKEKKLVVRIPPGVREGQRIRLGGMGRRGTGGGEAGDLYLRVEIRKPIFQRIMDFFSNR
jgi:DnaJ-class molecular chaperone